MYKQKGEKRIMKLVYGDGVSRYVINELLGINLITGAEYNKMIQDREKREFDLAFWLLLGIVIDSNYYLE